MSSSGMGIALLLFWILQRTSSGLIYGFLFCGGIKFSTLEPRHDAGLAVRTQHTQLEKH